MITFVAPRRRERSVKCDGCGRSVNELVAQQQRWTHHGDKKKDGLPIGGKDYCPKCRRPHDCCAQLVVLRGQVEGLGQFLQRHLQMHARGQRRAAKKGRKHA